MIKAYRKTSNEMIEMGLMPYPNAKQTIEYLKNKDVRLVLLHQNERRCVFII